MSKIVKMQRPNSVTSVAVELPARLVADWTPDLPVTREQAEAIPEAIAHAKAAVEPIDPRSLAVMLERTLDVWTLPPNWDDVAEFYVEALEDVPLDLVHSALKHLRMTIKWFPKPCELRSSVTLELDRRRHVLRRLEVMAQKVRLGAVEKHEDWKPASDEDKARVRKILSSIKTIPPENDDDGDNGPEAA